MNNIIKNKINSYLSNNLFMIIMFILLIKPSIINANNIINNIANIVMLVAGTAIIVIYFIFYKISKIQISIIINFLILLMATFFKSKDYIFYFKIYFSLFVTSVYSEILIKNNIKKFLRCLSYFFITIIVLNFITMFFSRIIFNSTSESYMLGYDNSTVITVLIGTIITLINGNYKATKKDKIIGLLCLLISLCTYIMEWAVSCMLNTLFITFALILLKNNKIMNAIKKINIGVVIVLIMFILLLIIVFRVQNYFSGFLVNVLHKDITFTNRTYIWDDCFKVVKNNFWIGTGVWNYETRLETIGIYHAHCTVLNVMLEAGILGLISYFYVFYVAICSFQKNKENVNIKIVSLICLGIIVYFTSTLVDVIYRSQAIYILLNIAFFAKYLTLENKNTNDKKILIINPGVLPNPAISGGAVETLIDIYTQNCIDNYDIIIYSAYRNGIRQIKNENEKIRYRYIYTNTLIAKIKKILPYIINKLTKIYIGNYYILSVVNDIIDRFEENDYECVIVENESKYVIPVKKHIKTKIILHQHNNYLNESNKINKKIINNTDLIITVSDFVKKSILKINKNANVVTVYNGIEIEKFERNKYYTLMKHLNIDEDDIVIGYIGRIVPEKGIKELLEAFDSFQNQYKAKLLLIGCSGFDTSKNTEFIMKCKKYCNNNIIFTGYIDNSLLYKYYSMIDILVVPSIIDDAFPTVILEGMAMGCAIIASKSGGIPEQLDEKSGILIERKNIVENIKSALEEIVENKDKMQKIRSGAIEKSSLFTKERFVNDIWKIIENEINEEK